MASTTTPRPSFELELRTLVGALRSAHENATLADVVFPGMEALVSAFYREHLEGCSNKKYSPELAKSLIAAEDFSDLFGGQVDEHVIRKHVRSIVLSLIGDDKGRIRKKNTFGIRLPSIGLVFGWSSETSSDSSGASRSQLLDGNVIVLIALTFALGCILLLK